MRTLRAWAPYFMALIAIMILVIHFRYRSDVTDWENISALTWDQSIFLALLLIWLAIVNWLADTRTWMSLSGMVSLRESLSENLRAQAAGTISPLATGEHWIRMKQAGNLRTGLMISVAYRWVKLAGRILPTLFFIGVWEFRENPSIGTLLIITPIFLLATLPRLLRRLLEDYGKVDYLRKQDLLAGMAWAVVKFLAYSLQLFLFLGFLGVDFSFTLLVSVTAFYALAGFIPQSGFLDPIIRSGLGSLFFVNFDHNPLVVLGILVVWTLNVGLPALYAFLVWPVQIQKRRQTRNSV
ncbi:MAG: hypothetical protein LPK46_01500 [Bacteroidota bacterium]|nr:hypothetical protein [Bacteroidota bacterium]MDX5447927.1 hypothetical protein [Bacteroidota bacterium]MDX5504792.1 hypothetical protein [Bacteroidota bacterium]